MFKNAFYICTKRLNTNIPKSILSVACIACNFLYRDGLQNRDKTHCQIMKLEVKAFIKKEVQRLKAKAEITPEDATEIDAIKQLLEYETTKNMSQDEI